MTQQAYAFRLLNSRTVRLISEPDVFGPLDRPRWGDRAPDQGQAVHDGQGRGRSHQAWPPQVNHRGQPHSARLRPAAPQSLKGGLRHWHIAALQMWLIFEEYIRRYPAVALDLATEVDSLVKVLVEAPVGPGIFRISGMAMDISRPTNWRISFPGASSRTEL